MPVGRLWRRPTSLSSGVRLYLVHRRALYVSPTSKPARGCWQRCWAGLSTDRISCRQHQGPTSRPSQKHLRGLQRGTEGLRLCNPHRGNYESDDAQHCCPLSTRTWGARRRGGNHLTGRAGSWRSTSAARVAGTAPLAVVNYATTGNAAPGSSRDPRRGRVPTNG